MEQEVKKAENFTNNKPLDDHYDIEVAKQKVKDFIGDSLPVRTCGFQVLVALYIRKENEGIVKEDGTTSLILAPEKRVQDERFRTNTGMVVQMGPLAYKGANFVESGPWCRVGDWVTIPRHEGTQFEYMGKPMFTINDDKIMNVIEDPSLVKRGAY